MTPTIRSALALLAIVYAGILAADFLAPYDPVAQDRELSYAPPTRVHFVDREGRVHVRPFVYPLTRRPGTLDEYEEDPGRPSLVRFFVSGHLVGVDSPARLLLLGADEYGRDLFSRFLYGGRISLFAGLFGAAISLTAGIALGTMAGFYGDWIDGAVMRAAELFLALPWLYLLFAVRMLLPLHIEPGTAFLLLMSVIALAGWARPARLVRGVVLSAKVRDYVAAARSCGASDVYVLRRHVLPQLRGLSLTQAVLLVPQYTLAEVTLSFFGLGVGEPVPSWGNMLASAQRYHVVASYWWMLTPGLALVPLFFLYQTLADALHQRDALSL